MPSATNLLLDGTRAASAPNSTPTAGPSRGRGARLFHVAEIGSECDGGGSEHGAEAVDRRRLLRSRRPDLLRVHRPSSPRRRRGGRLVRGVAGSATTRSRAFTGRERSRGRLGAMATEQADPRGRTVLVRNTVGRLVSSTTHAGQAICHGPVVLAGRPDRRLRWASSDRELSLLTCSSGRSGRQPRTAERWPSRARSRFRIGDAEAADIIGGQALLPVRPSAPCRRAPLPPSPFGTGAVRRPRRLPARPSVARTQRTERPSHRRSTRGRVGPYSVVFAPD